MRKTGIHRAVFQMESVKKLREKLEELGSFLCVTHGKPEKFIEHLMVLDGV
jgi:deoxyribodipyrimidine photolyase